MSALLSVIDRATATAAAIGHHLDAVRVSHPLGAARAALGLGWRGDGGMEPRRPSHRGVAVRTYTKPADTVADIPPPDEVEVLRAAWRLGAPDVARDEFRPLPAGADPRAERHGLTRVFGGFPEYRVGPDPLVLVVTDGGTDWMVEAAAERGWVSYLFRPARGRIGAVESRTDDPTLDDDGLRPAPLPAWATPEPLGIADPAAHGHRHVWTFSRSGRRITVADWRARHGGAAR